MDEVTIDIPADPIETPAPTEAPQEIKEPQEIVVEKTDPITGENTETARFVLTETPDPVLKKVIERNEKGQIVKGIAQDTNKNGTAGRPCEYCQDKEVKQKIVDGYMKQISESIKFAVPWIEELALLLDVDDTTLVNWANKKDDDDVSEHPELLAAYSKLKSLQKLRLKQRAIGRFNPHGALYLLNADHKVVQTDRKIVTGENNEPLKIIITEERKINE